MVNRCCDVPNSSTHFIFWRLLRHTRELRFESSTFRTVPTSALFLRGDCVGTPKLVDAAPVNSSFFLSHCSLLLRRVWMRRLEMQDCWRHGLKRPRCVLFYFFLFRTSFNHVFDCIFLSYQTIIFIVCHHGNWIYFLCSFHAPPYLFSFVKNTWKLENLCAVEKTIVLWK